MAKKNAVSEKWNAFYKKIQPFWVKVKAVCGKIGVVINLICDLVYKLRKVFLTIPVVIAAIRLAKFNIENLPEEVGINLLFTGEYQFMLPQNIAIYGPLAVTALCLLLMLCSRRTLYPWVISIFTLVLPLLIWVTNAFPA